jgi:hypothetical protein
MICKPKKRGGVGIMDFKKQNEAPLIKDLHKFDNKENIPWVNLVWQYYEIIVPHAANPGGSF